jgi:UDP-xylose/UDP-N-acetylglucosamine transporter B4
MLLGILILKRNYSWCKYISVAIITIGIIVATLASSHSKPVNSAKNTSSSPPNPIETKRVYSATDFLIGISLLTFALFASARCGIYQEVLFTTYGKHAKEALFYQVIQILKFLFYIYLFYFIFTLNFIQPQEWDIF